MFLKQTLKPAQRPLAQTATVKQIHFHTHCVAAKFITFDSAHFITVTVAGTAATQVRSFRKMLRISWTATTGK